LEQDSYSGDEDINGALVMQRSVSGMWASVAKKSLDDKLHVPLSHFVVNTGPRCLPAPEASSRRLNMQVWADLVQCVGWIG
jgi:hypothetical protein